MKHLFFASNALMHEHFGALVDQALDLLDDNNNEIIWLQCDGVIQHCFCNSCKKTSICSVCKKIEYRMAKPLYSNSRVQVKKFSDYINKGHIKELSRMKFSYSNVNDIKEMKYKNANIGYAALSNYISYTRNLNPQINTEFIKFFDSLLLATAKFIEIIDSAIEQHNPDIVYVYNGRLNLSRPVVDICESKDIEYRCVETKQDRQNKIFYRVVFENALPHSTVCNKNRYEKLWRANENNPTRNDVAKSFFEKRRGAVIAGDKVYVAHQIKGLLPENWNENIENIVIFNSSEDEFMSIGGEWEANLIFPLQLDGIKAIVEHYVNDKSKHFYLKIHPNLIPVTYKYHTDLYKLKYPNLTVIAANSPVSTYTIMDSCDKVIVFGSSTGAEASYAKKPVIQLRNSLYNFANTVYRPYTINELWSLIDTKDLPSKYNDDILKYGYYYVRPDAGFKTKIDLSYKQTSLLGVEFRDNKYFRLLGSNKLFNLAYIARIHLSKIFDLKSFRNIPKNEA